MIFSSRAQSYYRQEETGLIQQGLRFCPDKTKEQWSKGIRGNGKRVNEINYRLRKLSWIGKEAKTGFNEITQQS